MKTFFTDIFPKLQAFSEKLDNLALLTNKHWVSIDDILTTKTVFIFRNNNELIVSTNGKVEKEKWEYIGNKSLLVDKKNESYLFKHGFFDENILALNVDSCEEYAVFVNENKYEGELNTIEKVFDFLRSKYLNPVIKSKIESTTGQIIYPINIDEHKVLIKHETDKGIVEIPPCINFRGKMAFMDGQTAPDGKYKYGFMSYFIVENGIIVKD